MSKNTEIFNQADWVVTDYVTKKTMAIFQKLEQAKQEGAPEEDGQVRVDAFRN